MWYAGTLIVVTLVGAGVAKVALQQQRALESLPAPREMSVPSAVRRADFVGTEACQQCHAAEYAAWRVSTHGQAGGPASTDRVIAPFDGRPIRFRNAVVTPRRSSSGAFEFLVARDSEDIRVMRVDGVIGGGHMEGGGTEGFVTRWSDGTYRFLPFDYSRHNREWFCNTGSRADRGWVPITPSLALEACGDWPPVRVLGDATRFANCQGCHASQLDVAFDTGAHHYETKYTTLAINCESCHGPGRRHIALMSASSQLLSADIGIRTLATLDKDQSMRVCFQCHAVKDRLRSGYLSGDSLELYYSLALPLLGDRPLTADGRVRTFAYQENQRYSDCYLNGGMRCTDCHDPHSQRYRDLNGTPLAGRFDDRQCTSCHASKGDSTSAAAHSHHPPQSSGSRCVGCHMPYIQHPELGDAIRYARSDHTIPIPRPAEDDAVRATSGCAICHRDRTPSELAAQVLAWYGALKPRKTIVASQRRAERDTGAAAGAALLGGTESEVEYSLIRSAGIARLIDRYVSGETSIVGEAAVQRLEAIAEKEGDLDTRALALAALHLTRGDAASVRHFLSSTLKRAGAHDAALRDRWSLVLGYAGDQYTERSKTIEAEAAYRKALEVKPGDAELLRSLANAERDGGDVASAIGHYRESLSSNNGREALTLVNLAIAQAAAGDTLAAVEGWRHANEIDPTDPLPLFNLANLDLLQSRFADAIRRYHAALDRDESLVPANVNLARAFAASGDFRDALVSVRRARRFAPGDGSAQLLESQLLQVLPGRSR